MAFAESLRRLRLERFLSQAELARQARMHAVTISRLEAGDQAPSARTVRVLADALGVEPRALASPEEVATARMLGRSRARAVEREARLPEPRGTAGSQDGDPA
jgi:transcriptional regulator with XRE-family HTH domain